MSKSKRDPKLDAAVADQHHRLLKDLKKTSPKEDKMIEQIKNTDPKEN